MKRLVVCLVLWCIFASVGFAAPNPPVFSHASGVYPEQTTQLTVTLSADAGAVIYYTLDGSRPTTSSLVYAGPLVLENGLDDEPDAISKIVTGDEGDKYDPWYAPGVPPRTIPVLRAMAYKDDEASEIVTASYIFGETAVQYGTTPIFSICAEWMDLFNTNDLLDPKGIYVNKYRFDKRKVANCYVEMFEHGARQVASWIELRIQGTSTSSRPKKSLRLTGYNGFGGKKQPFDYAFFPGKENTLYATIVLRLGGNDWGDSLIRDQVAQAISKHTLVDVQYGNACIVFLNGVYWGVHEIRERWEDGYFKYQHGGLLDEDYEEYSLVEYGSGPPAVDTGSKTVGAVEDFTSLLQQLISWDNDVSDDNRYHQITNRVNPDSNLQHFGASLFTGNLDWPQNNQRFWRTFGDGIGKGGDPLNDGRWNWTFHDMDFAFTLPFDYVPDYSNKLFSAHDAYQSIYENEGPYVGTFIPDSARVFIAMLNNQQFLHRYLNFLYLHLATAWSAPVTLAVLDEHAERFREAGMDENGLRWRQPHDEADWQNEVDAIRDYLIARPKAFAWHTRQRFGLSSNNTVVVNSAGNGTIEVGGFNLTSDALPGFPGFPFALPFPSDVPLTLTATPADGQLFAGWYETTADLPVTAPTVAFDQAANYGANWNALSTPNNGDGWANWAISTTGTNAEAYIGGSINTILNGETADGRSFALYARGNDYINLQRQLANARVLNAGETMSLDIGFGWPEVDGAAGAAFVSTEGDYPVQLILETIPSRGEAFKLYLNGTAYWLNNFPYITAAPIHMALTRNGDTSYTLRLTRGGYTYSVDVAITDDITGVRLYKNPYGDTDGNYDLFFNHLRVDSADQPGAAALARTAEQLELFYETGSALGRWTLDANAPAGAWIAESRLSNIGSPCFGLWANNNGLASLTRRFGNTLTTNRILSFDFQHNVLATNGSAGVNLLTGDGTSFTLLAAEGQANYMVYADSIPTDTGLPVLPTGLHVTVQPAGNRTILLTLNGTPFMLEADSAINGIRVYNHTAGQGTAHDVFFNNIMVVSLDANDDWDPGQPEPELATVFGPETYSDGMWTLDSTGNAGTFASSELGGDAAGLWANGGGGSDGVRLFGRALQAGDVLSFDVQNGGVDEFGASAGWELRDANGYGVCGIGFNQGNSTYTLFDGTGQTSTSIGWTSAAQHIILRMDTTQSATVEVYINSILTYTQSVTLSAPATLLRIWNYTAGTGSDRNVYFNNIWLQELSSSSASAATRRIRVANGDVPEEILLGTNTILTVYAASNRSIIARFETPPPKSDYQLWAESLGISDTSLAATNPATGLAYAEEYLRETLEVETLHSLSTDDEYIVVSTTGTGIDSTILINTNLMNSAGWRQATTDELEPVPGRANTYTVKPPEDAILAIRLQLTPVIAE